MDAQEQNLCLVNMPELVLDKILANIHNPSNVSRTCKYLYEIVCGMEKHRRVMQISSSDADSPFNIDADAVFDSIRNSHRTIKEMELRFNMSYTPYELNTRQMERISAIMKQFGATVTSLKFDGLALPINFILEFLQQATKLESLSFTSGKVVGSFTENSTMLLQLPSLKELEIDSFTGILDIVNLISAGSLNSIRYLDHSTESVEVLATILTRQHNIKTLTLEIRWDLDLTTLRVDHLQLETLIFELCYDKDSRFMEILKWQTNLKELRFVNCAMSGNPFQWICNSLKKLEVFEVNEMYSEDNVFQMLGELKQLRHFRTSFGNYLFVNGFESIQFKSESIEELEFGYSPALGCGELLNKVVSSMAHNLTNLTHLQMSFENFSALCFVLGHCTKIFHLSSCIGDLNPDQLTQQRFPNIQHLELLSSNTNDEMMSRSMTSIVRAMPNLKSMMMTFQHGLTFDVQSMNEFIKENGSLEYFYVNGFELHRELSTNDVVESIRCLTDQLKAFHIKFSPSTSPEVSNWHKIKKDLGNAFYVGDEYWNSPSFYLYKSGGKKFRSSFFRPLLNKPNLQ